MLTVHTPAVMSHVTATAIIVVLVGAFGRPDDTLRLDAEATTRVGELAVFMGQPASADADILAEHLEALTAYPPASDLTQLLAESLVRCRIAARSEPERAQVARELYAIMNGAYLSGVELARSLAAMRSAARCPTTGSDALIHAAYVAARDVPNPRRDWW
jgi:hypothetical protein